jgi:serine/threonine-protein kinase
MTTKAAISVGNAAESPVAEETIRRELKRIMVSRSFRQVDRLQRFLSFIVEETLAGRGDRLKEYPVGVDVFGKDSSFDPRMDPIVRVQARRLRIRLTSYYQDEGQNDEVIIDLPKGGYAPIFRPSENSAPARKSTSVALVSRNTVLVSPFADYSGSSDQDYFCKGLSQEIIHGLSKLESIVLVSREQTADPRGPESAPNAAIVVSGSVRRARDVVRVTTHLTDTMRGCYLWSDSIDGKIDDALAIQAEAARNVVQTVREQLMGGLTRKGSKRSTENLAALNMYLLGRYHLDQRTEQGLRKALEFFDKAIVEDPQFAEAYAGLSDAYGLLGHYGAIAPANVWTKAASNATQAVLLDDESAEAHASLAHVRSTQDWDWAGAEREFQRAISLNPKYAPAHHWYAVSCLAPLGRLQEALEEMLLAQALDPVSSIISRNIAVLHYYLRDYENAMEQCDHTIEQNPHFAPAYWTLGLIQEQRGDFDEAIAAFQRAINLSPPNPRILGALGRAFARAGRKDEALRVLNELEDLAKRRYISPFEQALIYFALNRMDEGFERLSKAYQDRCFELITIKVDPQFDPVKKDARFKALFQQLGLP